METLLEKIKKTNAYSCLECGKCTGVCPVSTYQNNFSPRSILTQTIKKDFESIFKDYNLWSCLSCLRCDQVCPADIRYSDLTQLVRTEASQRGFSGIPAHNSSIELFQRLMITTDLPQKRLDWIDPDIKTAEKGDILYYVGCAPYFDKYFADLDIDVLSAANSSLKLLNKMEITPAVMRDEACCGHDLLWNGDADAFKQLAERNINELSKTEAKTILFSCAECLSAYKILFPKYGFQVEAELLHMSEFLDEKISSGAIKLNGAATKLTYHDSCRLGRQLEIYDQPRRVLQASSSQELREMKQNRKGALCCGTTGWINCDITSRTIQAERLSQSSATGAEIMAVSCPKCQIHFSCLMKDQDLKDKVGFKIRDISQIVLDNLANE